jgi:hypothetical protein
MGIVAGDPDQLAMAIQRCLHGVAIAAAFVPEQERHNISNAATALALAQRLARSAVVCPVVELEFTPRNVSRARKPSPVVSASAPAPNMAELSMDRCDRSNLRYFDERHRQDSDQLPMEVE